jgi:hypothetical protein
MKNLINFNKYIPDNEYKTESRRELDLDKLKKTKEFKKIIKLGFDEDTSHQQELNNTIKFRRISKKEKEKDHGDVFYTVHPSGIIRRYNPVKSDDVPEGNGNDIKRFTLPFKTTKDYIKGLKYLYEYIKRKEQRKDYR